MKPLHRVFFLSGVVMWAPVKAANFDTPEAAVRSLEFAYVSKDIDAVLAAKDFDAEARFTLYKADPALAADSNVVKQAAEVLKRSFRDQILTRGFPHYENIKCSITGNESVFSALVRITENCQLPGGHSLKQTHSVLQTPGGWRVVTIPALS